MLIKSIKYTDFMDQERIEDFMFHIKESDWNKWMAKYAKHGGIVGYLQDLVNAKDVSAQMDFFDEMITMSYGVMAQNGRNFDQSEAVLADFKSCAAYNALFMELLEKEGAAQEFLAGIMPKKMMDEIKKRIAADPTGIYAELEKRGLDRTAITPFTK